jgi:hypothetical protein
MPLSTVIRWVSSFELPQVWERGFVVRGRGLIQRDVGDAIVDMCVVGRGGQNVDEADLLGLEI